MKLCVLHCGHPKTGSSSLQRFLAANVDGLAAHGILYPILERRRSDTMRPVFQHVGALKRVGGNRRNRSSASRAGQLDRYIDEVPHDVLLLSAEYLFRGLFYSKRSDQIVEYFKSRGYEIETVTYLRDQADRLNSAYVQNTKTGGTSLDFESFCAARIGQRKVPEATKKKKKKKKNKERDRSLVALFFTNTIDPKHDAWGRHNFRPFANHVKKEGIEADFMNVLREILMRRGRPDLTEAAAREFVRPERVNESAGIVTVAVGRILAAKIEEFAGRPNINMLYRGVYEAVGEAIEKLGLTDGKYNALTPERYARLRSTFAESNDIVARRLWGKNWIEVFPDMEPSKLVSTDVADTDDPAVRQQVQAALEYANERFNAVISKYEEWVGSKRRKH